MSRSVMRGRGFTLLELLIALAITGLVLAMVGSVLVSTLDADQKIHDRLQTEKTGYGILSLIRHDLEGCYCYALGAPAFKGERGSEGYGTADKVAFVTAGTAAPDATTGRRPWFQRVAYRLKSEGQGGVLALYRSATPYEGGDPLAASASSQVASGIKSLAYSYLDPKDKTWKDDEWGETDRVPLAVKVALELVPDQPPTEGATRDPTLDRFEMTVALPVLAAPFPPPPPSTASTAPPGK